MKDELPSSQERSELADMGYYTASEGDEKVEEEQSSVLSNLDASYDMDKNFKIIR
jgi:hypothetical protein